MTKIKPLLILALLTLATCLRAAEEPASVKARGFYADTFLSLATSDFSHDETFGYGVGVGYQINPTLAFDARLTHDGLDIEGAAVSAIGARVVARLPWQTLSPYGFLGARYDLKPDEWRLLPGIGAEIGVTKLLKGMSLFGEAGLDADLKGHSGYLFSAGIRLRF